jgi:hypothetical protein
MFTPGQLSGLWLGEAKPDAALESEVPANPITWSLVLLPGSGVELSAFGGGYFDDCGDVPGQPVRTNWPPFALNQCLDD